MDEQTIIAYYGAIRDIYGWNERLLSRHRCWSSLWRWKTADYKSFFEQQMVERDLFHYPPYYRLIEITIKHKDYNILNKVAFSLAKSLQKSIDKYVLGPNNPPVGRIQNFYIKTILLKIENTTNIEQIKQFVSQQVSNLLLMQEFKSTRFFIDVDPM